MLAVDWADDTLLLEGDDLADEGTAGEDSLLHVSPFSIGVSTFSNLCTVACFAANFSGNELIIIVLTYVRQRIFIVFISKMVDTDNAKW